MVLRSSIIAVILLLNFGDKPGFWEFTGFTILGFLVYLLTIIPGLGLIVVIGCGYLTFNYLLFIQDLHWIFSTFLGIIVSVIMGMLFTVDKQGGQEMIEPNPFSSIKKYF